MRKTGKASGIKELLANSLLGAMFGLAATMLLLFVFAALMASGKLTESLMDSLVLVGVIAGSTFGGVYCAGRWGRGVITAGLTSAAAYSVIILLGTMIWMKNSGENGLILKIIIASFVGGAFGGVLKLYRRTKKSRVRH